MPAFTKGKWGYKVSKCIIYSKAENGSEIAIAEGQDNARLIAAAPEMYEFIRNVYYLLTHPDVDDKEWQWKLNRIHAEQILAQIEGREKEND